MPQISIQRKIQKHFISDYGDLVRRANFVQARDFGGLDEISSRIIWVDDNDAARARSDRAIESVKINLPAVIVNEGIAHEFHIVELGEKTEERITGFGDQEFIAGIAEKAEDEGIGFAGAGGENDVARGNILATRRIIRGNSEACGFEAFCVGGVREGRGI